MTSEIKHTPTHMIVSDSFILNEDGEILANTYLPGVNDHIVKCVNMHYELVEALKRQADNMAFVLNHMNTEGWYDKFISELSKDRETLKKAGAL